MTRTKVFVTGAAVAAAGLVGAVAFSGPAYASTSVNATYNCVTDQVPPVTYSGVTGTHTTSGGSAAPKITISTSLPAPIDIAANSLQTWVKTSAGDFTATANPELYAGDPVVVGPLARAGTVASATLPLGSGTPSSTNWQLRMYINPPGVNVYCVRIAVNAVPPVPPNTTTLTW